MSFLGFILKTVNPQTSHLCFVLTQHALCLELVVMDARGTKNPAKSFKQKEQEKIRGNQLARMKLAGFSQ
jgi:hypothetical protein